MNKNMKYIFIFFGQYLIRHRIGLQRETKRKSSMYHDKGILKSTFRFRVSPLLGYIYVWQAKRKNYIKCYKVSLSVLAFLVSYINCVVRDT